MMTDGHRLALFQKLVCVNLDLIIFMILTEAGNWDANLKVKRLSFTSIISSPPSEMLYPTICEGHTALPLALRDLGLVT